VFQQPLNHVHLIQQVKDTFEMQKNKLPYWKIVYRGPTLRNM